MLKMVNAMQGEASASQKRRAMQQYTARCHVQDITNVLFASMAKPCPGSIYNVVDDNPAGRAVVMSFAASLLEAELSAQADSAGLLRKSSAATSQSKAASNRNIEGFGKAGNNATNGDQSSSLAEKRVSNHKIKTELSMELGFPSYLEGLTAIQQGDKRPFF